MQRRLSPQAMKGRKLLISFFLAAACQANVSESNLTVEEYFEASGELSCEINLACGTISELRECTPRTQLGECEDFVPGAVDACLEAMEDALDAVSEDPATCQSVWPVAACNEVLLWSDSTECGTTAGRPLFVDGTQRLPSVVRSGLAGQGPRARAAEHWVECARLENASVPAFTRLACELETRGAPAAMIHAAQLAADDERRHTELCLALANELADTGHYALGPMPEAPARPKVTLEQIATEALLEGCIAEGSAAAWASVARARANPGPAAALGSIAADELRHAALGWRIVGWALRLRPELASSLLAALDGWEREDTACPPTSGRMGLAEHGVLDCARERATARELVSMVVRPTLVALCTSARDTMSAKQPHLS